MNVQEFSTKAIRRSAVESAATAQFQTAVVGTLTIGESSMTFGDWRIPYKAIRSAVLQVQYVLGFPRYQLLVTDGIDNFLFHLPASAAKEQFRFAVRREGEQSLLRRFWWVTVVIMYAMLQMYRIYRY